MKVRIDIDENLIEDEIIIRCRQLDDRTRQVYDALMDVAKEAQHLLLYKGNVEYYVPLEKVLFF